MSAFEWFESWFGTSWYHQLYKKRDNREAAFFIDNLLNHLKAKPGDTMLDIACGQGRHSAYLSKKGFDVTGIDISTASIAEALKSANSHLHFYVHDMRREFRINYFDFGFNFFTSFGYFDSDRDHVRAAKAMATNLKPQGYLVVDYLNGRFVQENLIENATIETNGLVFKIKKHTDLHHVYKDIFLTDDKGGKHAFRERVRLFSLMEMKALFKEAGMELVDCFGNYHLLPYEEVQSERMIMIFIKTGNAGDH